jgi:orotidine-5'-phosphate decarboxylase
MSQVVIALDSDEAHAGKVLRAGLLHGFTLFKIGHVLFDTHPGFLDAVTRAGGQVLLDLKFHDIPSVIGRAVRAVVERYPLFGLTVHTVGGRAMAAETMRAVRGAVSGDGRRPVVFGVTVLTSLDADDLRCIGFGQTAETLVPRLAAMAREFGLDGVVCSPGEIGAVKGACGADFLTLVPGVAVSGPAAGDQKRTATLPEVVAAGADYIVLGRSVYDAPDLDRTLATVRSHLG